MMNFSRRDFLRFSALGAAALMTPTHRLRAATHTQMGGSLAPSPALTPFVDALPIPPVLKPKVKGKTDTYTLTMKPGWAKCHRDLPQTSIMGFNGLFPGPTIVARKNRQVQIRQINNLPPLTMGSMVHLPAIHLHGAHVAPSSDGHPNDVIPTDGFRDYTYPNRQRGCMLWYHDHTHGATGQRVYEGLAGIYLLADPAEALLRLPKGTLHVPLLIQDRSFEASGRAVYTVNDDILQTGFHGDCILVNGKVQPFFQVATRCYRFRILNGSNARIYKLALSNGEPLIKIGTDGGLLQRPVEQTSIEIAPSERVDVLIDFSKIPLNTQIVLQNLNGEGRLSQIMRFDVVKKQKETWKIPKVLVPWEELPEDQSVMTREFHLNRTTVDGVLTWTINGKAYDPSAPPLARPTLDSIEHWKFINPTNHPHPLHVHLVQFQVVAINGEPVDASDYGWKDTVLVPPASDVTVVSKFSGYTGRYVFHCHNLEHEDFAMMNEFEVVAPAS